MTYGFLEGADEDDERPGHLFPFQGMARIRHYGCRDCHRRINFGSVLYMSRIAEDSFTMGYTCLCTNEKSLMESRFQVDRQAMKNLLGSLRPHLPYRAAPGPYLRLSEEDEKRLQVFAFDLDGIDNVEDFLTYVDGPGSGRHSQG